MSIDTNIHEVSGLKVSEISKLSKSWSRDIQVLVNNEVILEICCFADSKEALGLEITKTEKI